MPVLPEQPRLRMPAPCLRGSGMSGRRLTRNELLMRISGEMRTLAAITPTNPMDLTALVRNAKDTEIRLARLARVVSSMVPSHNYGGIDEANDQYREYLAEFHPDGKQVPHVEVR